MFSKLLEKPKWERDVDIWFAYIIVFAIILTPAIRIDGIPSFRIEQIVVFVFLLYKSFKNQIKNVIERSNLKFIVLYSCFSLVIIFSIIVGFFKGVDILFRDFLEIYKIIVYLSIYLSLTYIASNKNNRARILKFSIFCLIVSVLIAIQQYFNIFGLNEKYVPYIAPSQYTNLINNHRFPRSVGMTSNPNEYAILPGIGFVSSWAVFLKSKEKKYILFMFIFLFGELTTLSRSGFLFFVLGFLFYTIFEIISNSLAKGQSKKQVLQSVVLGIVALLLVSLIVFVILPDEFTWRLLKGVNVFEDSSFQLRLENWREHISIFRTSPFFGVGPGKSIVFEHHVDNEWLMLLKRYGIFGTTYFVLAFVLPFINYDRNIYKNIYFAILIGAAVYMIPAIIYNSFQVMALVFVLIGLIPEEESVSFFKTEKRL